ncbi:MAG: hypothetical protein QMD08_02080 [Actinomycetota bacterium]|nr:hypothetical protein [Actinomycetota bacterium]
MTRGSKLCSRFLVVFLGFLLFLSGLPLGSSYAQENKGAIFFEGETVPVVREPYTTVDLRIAAANLTDEHPQILLKGVAILDEVGKKVKERKTEKKLANLSVKIEDEEVLRENLGLRKRDPRKRNKKLVLSEEDVESGLYLGNLELDLKSIKPSLKVGDEVPFAVVGTFSVGESDVKIARQLSILYSDPLPRPQDEEGFWVPGDGHVHTAYSHEWIIPWYIKPSSRAAAAASVGLGWLNITDHAPNMSFSDWTNLVQDCGQATGESGVITLPGLELSTMDVDEFVYKPDEDYQKPYDSHYLAYDLSGFIL